MMHDPFNPQPETNSVLGSPMGESILQRMEREERERERQDKRKQIEDLLAQHGVQEPAKAETILKPSARDVQVGGDHYKRMSVQPWDVVDTWPIEQRIGYYRGNALKYLMRAGTKGNAVEDLGKAVHYVQKLIEVVSKM